MLRAREKQLRRKPMKETKTRATFGRHDWLKRKLMHANVGWMIVGPRPPKMSLSSAAYNDTGDHRLRRGI